MSSKYARYGQTAISTVVVQKCHKRIQMPKYITNKRNLLRGLRRMEEQKMCYTFVTYGHYSIFYSCITLPSSICRIDD